MRSQPGQDGKGLGACIHEDCMLNHDGRRQVWIAACVRLLGGGGEEGCDRHRRVRMCLMDMNCTGQGVTGWK